MAERAEFEDEKEHFEKGRVCSFPLCDTVLSIYNESDRCRQHADTKVRALPRIPKGRRKRYRF